jgi:hypothetical protein
MLKLGCELDLASESLNVYRRGQVGWQNFNYDFPAERCLLGHEHSRHTPAAKLTLESVCAAKRALELVLQVSQEMSARWDV